MNKEHNHVYRGCIFCPGVNIQELYILPGLYIYIQGCIFCPEYISILPRMLYIYLLEFKTFFCCIHTQIKNAGNVT